MSCKKIVGVRAADGWWTFFALTRFPVKQPVAQGRRVFRGGGAMFQHTRSFVRRMGAVPPIQKMLDGWYARDFAQAIHVNWFRGVYPDFASARDAAPTNKPLGYNNPEPASAEMYRFRMQAIAPCDYPVAFWLSRLMLPGQSLLDFGGHSGVLFYALNKYLTFPEGFSWQVYDLPVVLEEARRFAEVNNAPKTLSFCDDYKNAGPWDYVLFSGSLQYLEESLSAIILKMKAPPDRLLINMLPVHPEQSYYTLQNISTAFCPYRIYSANELMNEIDGLNGTVIDEWRNTDKRCEIPYHPSQSLGFYRGLLVDLVP
ncbi:methyltransferase, TIGR04325 family [Marinobacter salinisoli]|uniref:Methyltransferase, TIGR04325 family n=1 Tax=Marinobacter salinisoli TaxID=2769486 RepID=A0ABX7MNT0_9GAMM|nr:methyltransferase, TIGR04325 family [Marinobacter salinisoli]QSP93937.1 methyltransferase, TIGR04325 family [Marinobacter salinisoli]